MKEFSSCGYKISEAFFSVFLCALLHLNIWHSPPDTSRASANPKQHTQW